MYMYKNLFAFNNSIAHSRGKGYNPSATAKISNLHLILPYIHIVYS